MPPRPPTAPVARPYSSAITDGGREALGEGGVVRAMGAGDGIEGVQRAHRADGHGLLAGGGVDAAGDRAARAEPLRPLLEAPDQEHRLEPFDELVRRQPGEVDVDVFGGRRLVSVTGALPTLGALGGGGEAVEQLRRVTPVERAVVNVERGEQRRARLERASADDDALADAADRQERGLARSRSPR